VLKTVNDLGADATIHLDRPDKELAEAFARELSYKRFDVVIDYLWGHPTEVLLDTLTRHELKAHDTRTRLIEVGEMAAPTIMLSAAALRSSGLELYGSGGGSVPPRAISDTFPQLWALAASGKLRVDTEQAPLADIEATWQRQPLSGRRLVIIP
jgi:NADPH2:quinone reductase